MVNYKGRVDLRLKASINSCYAMGDSLIPRLGLIATFQPTGLSAAVISVDGYVRIQTASGIRHLGALKRFCGSTPPHPMSFYPTTDTQEQFVVDLDWRTVDDIEKLRDGKEFQLHIELNLLCAELSEQSEVKALTNLRAEVTRNGNSGITITQKEWAEVLNRWGTADLRIIEISMPRNQDYREHFETALGRIHEADQKLINGDFDGALVSCRKAFEKVQPQLKELLASMSDNEDHAIRRSKVEDLRKAIFGLYSVGAHSGIGATRAEAALGISLCKEFLSYLSKAELAKPLAVAA